EFFDSMRSLPTNGNIASYRSFILSQDNVGAVQVYPAWQGGGTVLCSILDGNYDPATPTLIEIIQNLVCPPEDGSTDPSNLGFGIAPVGAVATIGTATPLQIDVNMTVQLSSGVSLPSVTPLIVQAIYDYFLSVRRSWGNALITNEIVYPVSVYIAQINALILQITGIVNVTGTTLNGDTSDLSLTQTGELQQIPVIGVITVNGEIINNPS
ncbi:MAG: baseplate J/gp47 family protein, partial [Oscillospiraceae bacterium]|nr:baseplate J/gp47 family protein [Oscillospiraceae bacterium]